MIRVKLGMPSMVPAGILIGYGCAWFSHFFIEKNRPATFKYPLWSFRGDWQMWAEILAGKHDFRPRFSDFK